MREPLKDRERLEQNNIPELREQVVRYLTETNWDEWEQTKLNL